MMTDAQARRHHGQDRRSWAWNMDRSHQAKARRTLSGLITDASYRDADTATLAQLVAEIYEVLNLEAGARSAETAPRTTAISLEP